ncbi:MAG: HAD family phosphatase [Pseudomonadota bacterium]
MTAVVFDVGNVLIRWDPFAVFPEMPRAEIQAFFDEVGFLAWNLEQDRGRPWAEAVGHLSALYPHRIGLIERFHADWMRSVIGPVEGTAEIVEALAARGHEVHAITNFSSEKWEETVGHYPILKTGFGQVIVSGHEGVVKPDPRIYDLLCKRAGFKPRDALFIDDSAMNVAGARALGMAAHQFRDAAGLRAELQERGLL